jgi:site-specific DNA-methyltransferase (adenine-specific)
VWCYRGGGSSRSNFSRRHDTIFRYTKGKSWTFNGDAIRIPYSAGGQGRRDASMWGRHGVSGKSYHPNPLGKIPEDWWEIPVLNANDPERIGYPTQKPVQLLSRIIRSSSNIGDLVLDPFVGGGTTLSACEELGRSWLGIDSSASAIHVSSDRLTRLGSVFEVIPFSDPSVP